MPEEHNTTTNGVPPVSEAFGNERSFVSEGFGKEAGTTSERFGNIPNLSERNDESVPNASEPFGKQTPSPSETGDESVIHPPRRQVHTLTVREVEKLFEQAERPVTERSILNWCKPNSEGVCRLNCGYERSERRWYIAPESVERVIEEEHRKEQVFPKASLEFSETSERLSETFGNDPGASSESFGNVPKEESRHFGNVPNRSEASRISVRHEEPPQEHREVERHQDDAAYKKQLETLQQRIIELDSIGFFIFRFQKSPLLNDKRVA